MPGKTLLILGSGPGIGVAVARNFSVRGFTHVALVSRNKDRLAQDEDQVLTAIQERGYSCQVKTYVCDISDLEQLKGTLGEVRGFGTLECVLFNAARVSGGPPLEESTEAIERDFRVCCFSFILCLGLGDVWLTLPRSSPTSPSTKQPNGPFPSSSKHQTPASSSPQQPNSTKSPSPTCSPSPWSNPPSGH